MWLRNFLYELGFGVDGHTPVYCDNTAAKGVAENPVASRQLRHVARRHFFVQDAVRAGAVTVPYVASDANLADCLTKILSTAPRFEWATSRLRSWVMAVRGSGEGWANAFFRVRFLSLRLRRRCITTEHNTY